MTYVEDIADRMAMIDWELDIFHPESKGDDLRCAVIDYITDNLHGACREDDLQELERVTDAAVNHFRQGTRPSEEDDFSTLVDKIADAMHYAHLHGRIKQDPQDLASIAIYHVNFEFDLEESMKEE